MKRAAREADGACRRGRRPRGRLRHPLAGLAALRAAHRTRGAHGVPAAREPPAAPPVRSRSSVFM